ncbi:MAG TPA: nuclear transport factor 2 family protein [Verrucomicrobiae bacterium]|nr:nuclear transport factor 2 family protein [Verrucomicrobiae bacterium]
MWRITKSIIALGITGVLTAAVAIADTATPTAQSALAADESISRALLANDTKALRGLLADDWIVVSAQGGYDGRDDILQAIDTGVWTHTQVATSSPRVRIYGTTALVTEHATVSGMSHGKPYSNIQECQTDVLVWKDGAWVSELLHESYSTHAKTNC